MSTDTNLGRALAQHRWAKPENVDRRVDALADSIRAKLDSLPPLTPAQREKLAALLRPTERGAR